MSNAKTLRRVAILTFSLAMVAGPGASHAFNMGNMMNPTKWFGNNNNRDRRDYYDDRYGYGGPGYGYGGPGYGYGGPGYGYGYGAPGYGYGAPGYGYGGPGYGYGGPGQGGSSTPPVPR